MIDADRDVVVTEPEVQQAEEGVPHDDDDNDEDDDGDGEPEVIQKDLKVVTLGERAPRVCGCRMAALHVWRL